MSGVTALLDEYPFGPDHEYEVNGGVPPATVKSMAPVQAPKHKTFV